MGNNGYDHGHLVKVNNINRVHVSGASRDVTYQLFNNVNAFVVVMTSVNKTRVAQSGQVVTTVGTPATFTIDARDSCGIPRYPTGAYHILCKLLFDGRMCGGLLDEVVVMSGPLSYVKMVNQHLVVSL
jgi:hypothetical protein